MSGEKYSDQISLNCFRPFTSLKFFLLERWFNEDNERMNAKCVRKKTVWAVHRHSSRKTIIQLNHEVPLQFNLIFKELLYPIELFVAVFHRVLLVFLLLFRVFFSRFSSSSSHVVHFTPINLEHLFDFSKGLSTVLINSIIADWIIYRQLITMLFGDDCRLITDGDKLRSHKILTFSYWSGNGNIWFFLLQKSHCIVSRLLKHVRVLRTKKIEIQISEEFHKTRIIFLFVCFSSLVSCCECFHLISQFF